MRIALAVFALGSAHTAHDCSFFASAPPPPAASVSASLALPAAAHGGTVIAAEDAPVEVVVEADGAVKAYPLVVAEAKAVPPTATVYADVHTTTGQPRTVELHWAPASARFEGQLVGVAPAPGPLTVRVDVDGEIRRSAPTQVVMLQPPSADVHVHVDAPPPPRAEVHVHADLPPPPSAEVHVHANGPRPRASARAELHVVAPPPPRVRVEVNVPRPPSVSVHAGASAHVGGGAHFKHRGRGHGHGRGHRH
jgi:hypothetical protein